MKRNRVIGFLLANVYRPSQNDDTKNICLTKTSLIFDISSGTPPRAVEALR